MWKDRTLTLLQVWSESLRTKSSWCGCYDNAVARIIPRITSKVATQMRTNITFCKEKRQESTMQREGKHHPQGALMQLGNCPSLGTTLQVREEGTGNHLSRQDPAVWSTAMNE